MLAYTPSMCIHNYVYTLHLDRDLKVLFFSLIHVLLWKTYFSNIYSRQRMFVRWGDTCSTRFCVTNGVKQGGIISPMLFNLYIDALSLMLN